MYIKSMQNNEIYTVWKPKIAKFYPQIQYSSNLRGKT